MRNVSIYTAGRTREYSVRMSASAVRTREQTVRQRMVAVRTGELAVSVSDKRIRNIPEVVLVKRGVVGFWVSGRGGGRAG